jgi:hypothetical protein
VLPDRVDQHMVGSVRAILDEFDVGGRLRYIRDFVWRGGTIQLRAEPGQTGRTLDIAYALTAEWAAAVLEREAPPGGNDLAVSERPVLEGRWVRGSSGYALRIGIDLAVPSAMYIRSQRLLSHVPFLGRPAAQVEHALNQELTAYVNTFLARLHPVPEAAAIDARRLRGLGLAA